MAKYQIKLPAEVSETLQAEVEWADKGKAFGHLPSYPVFVNRLMKEMETPADELHHACTGMAGEAGELLDLSKKVWAYGKQLDLTHTLEELGDLRFYYQAMLNMLGITDEQVRAHNMVKLNKRYASGTYSDAQAIARADKQPGADRKFMGKPEDSPTLAECRERFDRMQDAALRRDAPVEMTEAERQAYAAKLEEKLKLSDVAKAASAQNPAEVLRDVAQKQHEAGGPEVDHASFDAAAEQLQQPATDPITPLLRPWGEEYKPS